MLRRKSARNEKPRDVRLNFHNAETRITYHRNKFNVTKFFLEHKCFQHFEMFLI